MANGAEVPRIPNLDTDWRCVVSCTHRPRYSVTVLWVPQQRGPGRGDEANTLNSEKNANSVILTVLNPEYCGMLSRVFS